MSITSQAIQEIEAKVVERLKAHNQAIDELKQSAEQTLTEAISKSQSDLLAYKQEQEQSLATLLTEKQNIADEETKGEIEDLTEKISQKESELVLTILEEVQNRYGSL